MTYTCNMFDGDSMHESSPWHIHPIQFEAKDDEAAIAHAKAMLEDAAADLTEADGYTDGSLVTVLVWGDRGMLRPITIEVAP